MKNEIKLQNQNIIENDKERNVREWNKHLDFLMDIYNKEQDDVNVDNFLKLVGQRPQHTQKTIDIIINHHAKDITEGNKRI